MTEVQPNPLNLTEDLLQTKLAQPRLHASLIQRPTLFARLDEAFEKRLTLIIAPTGYGKSTLVSLWLNSHRLIHQNTGSQPFPVAWISLDEDDNDPARFWRYVINGFRQIDPEVGKSTLAALRVTQQPHYVTLLTGLINELAQLPPPTVLVLDDLHSIHAPEVLKTLAFLIEHLPPNIHVIAMARNLPGISAGGDFGSLIDWPLDLLRARGELCELGAGDLRFSTEEINTFLVKSLPAPLSTSKVKRLEEKTEGWPAGIRLVTLAMLSTGQSAEQVIETFNGEHRFVLAYLRKEVFDRLPESIRAFLLQTCFFDRLTGPLCDALTGRSDSADLLEQLEQSSLFVVPLGSSQGQLWYRYQSLFAEAMRKQALQTLGEPAARELAAQASHWYEEHGLLEEAIASAVAADAFDRAIRLVERFLEQRSFYEILIVLRWCEAFPEDLLRQHPLVAFNYALAVLFTSDRYAAATASTVRRILECAEQAWRDQKYWQGTGQVLAVYSIIAWWQGDFKTSFDYVHQALAYLPDSELMWRSTAFLGLGNEAVIDGGSLHDARSNLLEAQALSGAVHNIHGVLAAQQILAEIHFLQGEMDAASANFQQVLVDAIGGDEMLDDQSIAWYGMARAAYERNDLSAAEEHARRAADLGMQRDNESVWAPASILLALISHARGDTAPAQMQLQSLLGQVDQPQMLWEIWLALARLSLAAGDLSSTLRWQERLTASSQTRFASERERVDLLAARIKIAEGRPEEALALIRPWQAAAREQGRLRSEIETLCLEALALDRLSDTSQAFQRLAAALSLAQPRGFRRLFLDEGDAFARLLRTAISTLQRRGLVVYATVLLHSFPAGQSSEQGREAAASAPLIEPLSAQEIRVLRLIAAGRTNPEIAEELVVSVNTIKTQVQSVYRKLNVNSREEAREAAKELSLI